MTVATATTVRASLAEATLAALLASENGALTDVAIREQVGSMRAVPSLVRRGLVRTSVSREWMEVDGTSRMELVDDVVTVRLVNCRGCGRELRPFIATCCGA